MDTFMNLPDFLVEKLEVEELVLIKGGAVDPPGHSPNNGDGICSGTNNASGRCGGTNNGDGRCGS